MTRKQHSRKIKGEGRLDSVGVELALANMERKVNWSPLGAISLQPIVSKLLMREVRDEDCRHLIEHQTSALALCSSRI